MNILQGTRICVEVACSHQYLGRGSPHCIGLCRPHSWGFWWLRTIIYNEICKSARQYIFSFTPFTLESFVTQIRLPHPIIHSSIHPSNSHVCLSCTCVLELLEPIPEVASSLQVQHQETNNHSCSHLWTTDLVQVCNSLAALRLLGLCCCSNGGSYVAADVCLHWPRCWPTMKSSAAAPKWKMAASRVPVYWWICK